MVYGAVHLELFCAITLRAYQINAKNTKVLQLLLMMFKLCLVDFLR